MSAAVEIRGLTKVFPGSPPVEALCGVDLHVDAGQLAAVLGPSGCGKTTLLRIIAGFEAPSTGSVRIGSDLVVGNGAKPVPPERRRVGIVPQEGGLFPHLDVGRNIGFGLRGQGRGQRSRRVDELLDLVGLRGYARRRVHELSGGQQQRVALARALAPRPAIVLLDEPFTALDTTLRTTLRGEVAAVLRAEGTTAVLVTHDQTEALTMSDIVAVMRAGRIVQSAPPSTVYRDPVDLGVAQFVGDAVVLPAVRRGEVVDCVLGQLPVGPAGSLATDVPATDVVVMVRPEQIVWDKNGPLSARVRGVSFEGHDAVFDLDLIGHDGVSVKARWSAVVEAGVGDDVNVAVVGPVRSYSA
jgi:iron(III) transport system ATP-binding protein